MDNKILTDSKSYKYYYDGDSFTLINAFFNKIKPLCGIVKYKMINWTNFPKTTEEAQLLSKSWINEFKKQEKYENLNINIYFHLIHKTIRFNLYKPVNKSVLEFNIEDSIDNDITCYSTIVSKLNSMYLENLENLEKNIPNKFIINVKNWELFPNLDTCKILGKQWSENFQNLDYFQNYSIVTIFNIENSSILLNLKNK